MHVAASSIYYSCAAANQRKHIRTQTHAGHGWQNYRRTMGFRRNRDDGSTLPQAHTALAANAVAAGRAINQPRASSSYIRIVRRGVCVHHFLVCGAHG